MCYWALSGRHEIKASKQIQLCLPNSFKDRSRQLVAIGEYWVAMFATRVQSPFTWSDGGLDHVRLGPRASKFQTAAQPSHKSLMETALWGALSTTGIRSLVALLKYSFRSLIV